jgi:hypothetical protein
VPWLMWSQLSGAATWLIRNTYILVLSYWRSDFTIKLVSGPLGMVVTAKPTVETNAYFQ